MPNVMTQESAAEMRRQNPENFNVIVNGRMMRDPKRYIYLHSVAKRAFIVTRALFPKLHLAGCMNGERYVTCAILPDPIPQASPDQERGGTRVDEHDGWRAAIDLLNPVNQTTDVYSGADNPDFFANRQGQNLVAEGVFCSLHEVPTEAELKRAEESVKRHYQWLAREAVRLSSVSKKELNDFLQTYPDTHLAMDALGLSAEWHSASTVKSVLPKLWGGYSPRSRFSRRLHHRPVRAYKAGKISKDRMEELTDESEPKRGPGRPRKEG